MRLKLKKPTTPFLPILLSAKSYTPSDVPRSFLSSKLPSNSKPIKTPEKVPQKPVPIKTPDKPNTNSEKIALLMGAEYTAYAQKGILERLPGCHLDIQNAYKLLTDRYGYKPNNIHLLMDDTKHDSPTYANILNQFDILVDKCQKNTNIKHITLYYSGHGTSIKDINGDEHDGNDECMVPCDFQESGLIIDDILHDRFWTKLPNTVQQVTFISDSCNSGTIFDLPFLYQPPDQTQIFTKRSDDVKHANTYPLVISLSGCRDPQTSASAYNLQKNFQYEGAMSFYLRQCLVSGKYQVPMNKLMDELRTKLKTGGFSQIPQLGLSRDLKPSTITTLF